MQRLRLCYAKRGRLRFISHRDFQRAFERALRRAGVPVAFSAGYTPHPKVSYAGAAPTGVASEAEYLELSLAELRRSEWVRESLEASLPPGLDVLEVVEARVPDLSGRLEASCWQVRLAGVDQTTARRAAERFLAAESVEVQRLTKNGMRSLDARAAVVRIDVASATPRVAGEHSMVCAILRLVVRHVTPAVRPDDVLSGLRQVAGLAPPTPPLVTRLAQGPLDGATGTVADPLAPDRAADPPEGEAARREPPDGRPDGFVVGTSSLPEGAR